LGNNASNQRRQRPPLVALTGGIASGKTAVSDRLAELGAAVIDTDLIAREVVEPGQPALSEIAEAFGAKLITPEGNLDRRALREIVFADPGARKRLEAILHPRIVERVQQGIEQHTDAPYIVLVVPLLIETGLFKDAEHIVVVDVPEQTQIDRLTRRDGISPAQAQNILAAQATRQQRLAHATHVLDNTGSLEELLEQVDQLHQKLTQQDSAGA
jgi:dephospho-CoA kinase